MTNPWIQFSLAAAVTVAAPAVLSAQQQRSPFPDPRVYSEELTPGQIQRAQEPEVTSVTGFEPSRSRAAKRATAEPARAVSCNGAFAKDSNHLKLATAYKTQNVVFTEVNAGEGKKLMASVLFPTDPKRRLEVWWQNEAARAGTYLIVINDKSTWAAPKGVRLGQQLAALERANGKPFKLRGFDKDSLGLVSDWEGGALASLTGGCKLGVSLRPDAKAPQGARDQVPSSTEFASNDANIKALKPTVAEIIIGY